MTLTDTCARAGPPETVSNLTPRIIRLAPLLLAGVVLFLYLALSRNMTGPVVYEDGLAYFANARYIAGNRAVPHLGPMSFYYPGYSVLIAALYLLLPTPEAVYKGVLVLNAGLGALQFLLGYSLLRRVFGWRRDVAIWASLIAALYPGALLIGSYEYSDTLFRVVFVGCVLGAALFFEKPTPARGALLGSLAGFSLAVHPRGLAVVIVAAAMLPLAGLSKRSQLLPAAAGVGFLGLVVVSTRLLNERLIDAMYRSGDRSLTSYLSRLLAPDFWLEVPVRASGQLWYLTSATAGLFPVGVVLAAVGAWRAVGALRTGRWPSGEVGAQLFLLVGSAGLFAVSVIFMTPPARSVARLDHLIYGRYNDGFVPVFLMMAVGYLLVRAKRLSGRGRIGSWAPAAALLTMVLTASVLVVFGSDQLASDRPFAPISALGISPYLSGDEGIPVLFTTLAAGMLALLVLLVLPRISATVAVGVLCLAFVTMSFAAEARVLIHFNHYWMNLLTLHHSAREVGTPASIGYDEATLSLHGLNGYQFWLDRTEFRVFDLASGDQVPGVQMVVASETWDRAPRIGARLVAAEPRLNQGLWVLPGALQDRLAANGSLIPEEPGSELPAEAMASRLEIVEGLRPGDVMRSEEERTVVVRVTHEGKGAPWVPLGALSESPITGSVRLVARWFPVGQETWIGAQLAELPRTVLPGDEVVVHLRLGASWKGEGFDPGDYLVRIGLVQEGFRFFDEASDKLLDTPVRVVPPT